MHWTHNEPLEKLFAPGHSVQLVININSDRPVVRSSSIYDLLPTSHQMVMAQTTPPLMASTRYDTLDITTLVLGKNPGEKIRIGCSVRFLRVLNEYRLADGIKVKAFEIKYTPTLKKGNIRRAFRVVPTLKFEIAGSLSWDVNTYRSGTEFFVHDISLTGIALMFPHYVGEAANPLLKLAVGDRVKLNLKLRNLCGKLVENTVLAEAHIIRKNDAFTEKNTFVGAEFVNLPTDSDTKLVQFVQDVQLFNLRKEHNQ